MFKSAKTFVLLAGLSGLLLALGSALDAGTGGSTFLTLMLLVSLAMNFAAYFYSDKLAIKAARAQPMDEAEYPDVYAMVRELSARAGQPMPRLYVSPSPQLNAFATGRNPENAAVCVNRGLYEALTPDELEGVLGHELQHVYNRDILVGSVAAMIATSITFLARMAMWGAILGGGRDDEEGPGNAIGQMALLVLAPIAAMLIQFAVTRSRESLADETGAELTGKPLALASALRKLEAGANDPRRLQAGGVPAETNSAFAHMYISAPFGGRLQMGKLFSTHPPIPERVARLEQKAREMGQLA
ncbi:MAG: zinc metalloprotease HtpX [Actinomycetes bacterium]